MEGEVGVRVLGRLWQSVAGWVCVTLEKGRATTENST